MMLTPQVGLKQSLRLTSKISVIVDTPPRTGESPGPHCILDALYRVTKKPQGIASDWMLSEGLLKEVRGAYLGGGYV